MAVPPNTNSFITGSKSGVVGLWNDNKNQIYEFEKPNQAPNNINTSFECEINKIRFDKYGQRVRLITI